MSNYNNLKTTIDANIKQNGNQEITGPILNSVLNQMVNILGTGYQFAGVATLTPATDPGTPDAKVFYIANGKGTYTNFGSLEVTEDEVVVLYWDTAWHKEATGIASQAKLTELDKELGNLDNLNTNTKDSVVLAINEINEKVNSDVALSPELKSILLQCFSKVAWSVEDGQSYLNSLRAALYPSKLLGIRAEYNGGLVKVGTSIYDLDISVYAIYNGGVTEEIYGYTLSGEITSAENIITISYMGKTTSIVVNAAGIESITAIYNGGVVAIGTSLENLDISVYAVYSNGEREEVTDYILSGEISSETNIITITYSDFTTTIEVNAITRILNLQDMTYTSNGGTQISITNGNHVKLIMGNDVNSQSGCLISLSKLSSNNPAINNNATLINNQSSLFTISANETITLKLLNVIEDVTYLGSYGGLALGLKVAKSSTSIFAAIGIGKDEKGVTRPVQTQKTFSVPTDVGSVAVYLQLMASGSIIEFDLSMVNSDGKIYI